MRLEACDNNHLMILEASIVLLLFVVVVPILCLALHVRFFGCCWFVATVVMEVLLAWLAYLIALCVCSESFFAVLRKRSIIEVLG